VVATDATRATPATCARGAALVRSRLTDVVGPKRTALGEGWFVTNGQHLERRLRR